MTRTLLHHFIHSFIRSVPFADLSSHKIPASATYCATAVPAAAPAQPMLRPGNDTAVALALAVAKGKERLILGKMKRGSRIALRTVSTAAHFNGVTVSPRPRKMPLVTSQRVSAGAPRARTRRYDTAGPNMGLSTPMPYEENQGKSE